MKCSVKNLIKITQGSKEDVIIRLSDPISQERFDLTPFESAKACFKTTAGIKIEKIIAWPTAEPKLGKIEFTLDSADTAQFDKEMRSFELELVYTGAANNHIVVLENALEISERIC